MCVFTGRIIQLTNIVSQLSITSVHSVIESWK